MRATLLSLAARRPARPAHARCRLRHRRAGHRGRAARRRGGGDRPVAHAGRPGARAAAAHRSRAGGRVDFRVGDMLDPALGEFDHVVAMDSLIHYRAADVVRALARLAARTARLDRLHLRAAHPAAGADARGRPAVPARRPLAGHRAGRAGPRCSAASTRTPRCGLAHRPHRSASPAASTPRRRWSWTRR